MAPMSTLPVYTLLLGRMAPPRELTQAFVRQTAGWLVLDLTDNEGRKSERYVSQTDNLAYAHSVERSSLDLEEGLLRDCARLSKQFVSCRYSVTTE